MAPYVQAARYVAIYDEPEIMETNPAGAGTVTFASPGLCHVFIPGETPISWLQSQRCADGAILTTDAAGAVTAHLVELKTKVKGSGWADIKQQLEGLMHNVKALCAVVGAPQPTQFRAYIAFKTDAISTNATAAPVLLKPPLGGTPAYDTADWQAGEISLLDQPQIPLMKVLRDASGNAQATLLL